MKNIEDAILKVRENPYKYLGKKSLKNLDLFISGYTSCQINLEGTYSNWLEDFSQFIQKKFNMFYSVRYSDIISFFSVSDKHAFDEFYRLLDEFYQE
ncbi:hypothetical protein [[Clostridium] symbiosum]|uniref:hypothetical protein n=1 Tax=Clostridium symbiosum TaxID=1512 RepID=UPI001D07D631|nr:hypothetical protein [[Clostridium] symbiosum]MCB6611096.1 hypothetical protein [[Clostridium] symbiosum]